MMDILKQLLRRIFTPRRIAIGTIVTAIGVTIMLIFDMAIMPWYTKHGEALAVPNTVAKRYEVAKEILEMNGLIAVKAGEKYDSELPFGYIVEQNPRANRLVKRGRRVYLTISVGEKEIEMPDLVGLSETNAQERIKSFGLRVGEVLYEYVPNELADVVISQSEKAGSLVKASSAIDITVSLGRPTENVTVPFVIGKTLEVVKRELLKAGLTVGKLDYRVNDQVLPNTVLEQSIESGTVVKHGTRLNLLLTTFGEGR